MDTSEYRLSGQAELLLKAASVSVRPPTKYIALFATTRKRQIALERTRTNGIYVWTECHPSDLNGIQIANRRFPGQPYTAAQPRNSNLKNCRLGLGNLAYYLKFETAGTFERFLKWYANS